MALETVRRSSSFLQALCANPTRQTGPATALPALVPNATNAMTAVEPLQQPSFVQTYTHEARDPSVKKQITHMVLNGVGVQDTAWILGVNR